MQSQDLWDDDSPEPWQGSAGADAEVLQVQHEDLAELVDFDASSEEVLSRIEACILAFLEELAKGELPLVYTIPRTARNSTMVLETTLDEDGPEGYAHRLQHNLQPRSLTARQAEGAYGYVRIFKVLEVAYELVSTGRQATLRDVYYRLLCPPIFTSTRDLNEAIQDVVSLVRVPRSSLGICCASRGAVSGKLSLQEAPGGPWVDCSALGPAGKAISGSINAVQAYRFQSQAHYILVVEKDAIFQRLTEDRFFDLLPCIIVTAKGMPDMATRAFLHLLHGALPHARVLGLVDWNPSGVAILRVYKHGSVRMGLEAARYAIADLKWLGVRRHMLEGAEPEVWQPLTTRDRALIRTLSAGALQHSPRWVAELEAMGEAGAKAEIEALYSVYGLGGLAEVLAGCVVRQDFLH